MIAKQKEIWKDIPEFPGYKVSNLGSVIGKRGAILKPALGGRDKNQPRVNLTKNGNNTLKVSRIVYCVFNNISIGVDKVVMHIDDNPTNNNLNNLRLGTQSENIKDMYLKGRGVDNKLENHPIAKLRKTDIPKIKKLYSSGKFTQSYIARLYNVDQSVISRVVNNKKWVF